VRILHRLTGGFALKTYMAFKDVLVYKNTAALPAFQVVFLDQLLIGKYNRVSGHSKLLSEFTGRWEFASCGKSTVEYALDQFLPDLTLQIEFAVRLEVYQGDGHNFPGV